MSKINKSQKFLAQDNLYYFPYHYLPSKIANNIIKPFKVYHWLYDYILMIDFIKSKMFNLPSSNILDFGCGDGRLLFELKSYKENKYFGYEISKRANMLFNAFNPEIKLINELQEPLLSFQLCILDNQFEVSIDGDNAFLANRKGKVKSNYNFQNAKFIQ